MGFSVDKCLSLTAQSARWTIVASILQYRQNSATFISYDMIPYDMKAQEWTMHFRDGQMWSNCWNGKPLAKGGNLSRRARASIAYWWRSRGLLLMDRFDRSLGAIRQTYNYDTIWYGFISRLVRFKPTSRLFQCLSTRRVSSDFKSLNPLISYGSQNSYYVISYDMNFFWGEGVSVLPTVKTIGIWLQQMIVHKPCIVNGV